MNRIAARTTMLKNLLQTAIILTTLFGLMCLLGYTIAGTQGIYLALISGIFLLCFPSCNQIS